MSSRKPLVIVGTVVVVVAIIAFAWWLVSPVFVSTTVDEEFPLAATAVVPPDMTRAEVEKVMAEKAKVTQEMTEEMPDAMTSAEKIKSGSFLGVDRFHKGSGEATIYRLEDGSYALRLENFESTNGPDLHIILSPHPNPGSAGEVKTPGYVDLGKLKGNIGNQNYEIPAGTNVNSQMSVVIYCVPFSVVFSVASLET